LVSRLGGWVDGRGDWVCEQRRRLSGGDWLLNRSWRPVNRDRRNVDRDVNDHPPTDHHHNIVHCDAIDNVPDQYKPYYHCRRFLACLVPGPPRRGGLRRSG
jgi:hypothetical protein